MTLSKYELGRNIAAYRELRGWTVARLAKRLGIARFYVQDWERGHSSPVNTERVADMLGVPLEVLTEQPEPQWSRIGDGWDLSWRPSRTGRDEVLLCVGPDDVEALLIPVDMLRDLAAGLVEIADAAPWATVDQAELHEVPGWSVARPLVEGDRVMPLLDYDDLDSDETPADTLPVGAPVIVRFRGGDTETGEVTAHDGRYALVQVDSGYVVMLRPGFQPASESGDFCLALEDDGLGPGPARPCHLPKGHAGDCDRSP